VEVLKARLAEHFGDRLEKVVLYGSRAWGRPRLDSDVDLCIVVRGLTHRDRVDAIEITAEVAVDTLVDLAPLVLGQEQLQRYLDIEYRLAEDIVQRGIAL
jgi:predicted nucleotidyltransferase